MPRKPFHYVYMLYHDQTGLYYIGVRSSYLKPDKDNYWGSGSILWDVYHLQGYYSPDQGKPQGWHKYIVAVFDNRVDANRYETTTIRGEVGSEYCLNCVGTKKARLNRIVR